MRILFVTPYVPSRIRVRPYNLIKSLSTAHDISVVSLLVEEYEQTMVKDLEAYCVSVDLIPLPRWQAYANCLLALPTLTPLRVAYYRSPMFVRRIKEVIHRQHIDVVHGELIKVVPALKAVLAEADTPVLYDSVDCISWFLQQQLETTRSPLKKVFVYSELQKMRRYEQRVLVDFDRLIITNAHDRDYLLSALPQGALHQESCLEDRYPAGQAQNIEVVSNGVDTGYFIPWTGPRAADSLVFCAKLDYFPNAQAILHFCENTLPLIWKQRPLVHLAIVGSNPPQAVRKLAADERITVTGYVPDTRPYLGAASVAIAPLVVAAGMQNKVLEALSMAMPTVTTPRCSRALGLQDGVHLLVAAEPQAYANAVVKLLEDPELAQRLGRAGHQFVAEHYSWASAANAIDRLYHSMAAVPGQQELVVNFAPLA